VPSGEVHYSAWKMGWMVVLPACIGGSIAIHPTVGAGVAFGYLLGRWCDPDWDQVGISAAEGRIIKDFKIVGNVIVGYTTIYGSIFRKMHRSVITHFPFLSTVARLAYLFWWLYFLIPVLYDTQIVVGICVWLGLSVADMIHWVLDKFY
jgi:uncharacterized metal-binding protein